MSRGADSSVNHITLRGSLSTNNKFLYTIFYTLLGEVVLNDLPLPMDMTITYLKQTGPPSADHLQGRHFADGAGYTKFLIVKIISTA